MRGLLWVALAFVLCGLSCGSRILAVVPSPARSHHNLLNELSVELVNRGHQVTLITAFKRSKPLKNLEEVIYPNYYSKLMEAFAGPEAKNVSQFSMRMTPGVAVFHIFKMGLAMTDTFLSTPVIQKFVQSQRKYDLVIGESFFIEAVLAGFSKKFDAPLVAVAPAMSDIWSNYMVGNPAPSSVVPSIFLPFTHKMTFLERVFNTLLSTAASVYQHTVYLPKQDAILKKHFGADMPYVTDVITNTSLLLVNHHHSLAFPRSLLPNVVEVGGFHVRPVQPLPADLKLYLDKAKHGVILFSMGSHLKSASMTDEMLQTILNTFSKLRENVLWKFEDDRLKNIPENVKISSWLPQSDILAHPNVKLFISHGGLLSTTETTTRGVPILGIPVFGDQPINMKFIEMNGCGKMLSLDDLNESTFYRGIREVIDNPKYAANIKQRSLLLQDRPMSAMDTAMYWIEYVIKYKGAVHMRSAAQNLTWYQLHLFDVFAALAAIVLTVLYISYVIIKFLLGMVCGSKSRKTNSKKKIN